MKTIVAIITMVTRLIINVGSVATWNHNGIRHLQVNISGTLWKGVHAETTAPCHVPLYSRNTACARKRTTSDMGNQEHPAGHAEATLGHSQCFCMRS